MAESLAELEPRLGGLPRHVGERLRAVRAALHERTLDAVRATMREQGRSLTGKQGRGLALGVRTAVDAFVSAVAEPTRPLADTRQVFHALGRTEYQEGHRVDALRSVLTVGARAIWAFLVAPERPDRLAADELYVIAAALFGYTDTLAGAAAEGYLDEQRDAAHDWIVVRRRLITLLVQPDPPADTALHAAAEAARWPLPPTVAVISVDGSDDEHLARAVGGGAVATVIDDAVRIVLPDPDAPGRLAALRRALTGRRAALGPTVPVRQARASYRLSRRALRLHAGGALPADGVVDCDAHLLTLLTHWEPGLTDRLVARALAPLAPLGPAARRALAETLATWLDTQGQVVETARLLHTHPQTVRYRMRRLRERYGADLDDPDARLALHLALRHHLGRRP
ncbi:helix-turn-helix domain-containing protein [Micromonospora sp. NBRC 110038]|uniref:helix-turn-helix domain-containing protein n=1 Tax=Micromonospora sp. NBRC 110038 TaxID=1550034 RepID=UPI001E5AA0E7|nr:PucR family transcriptional regulator [Micromonospora sp. NBRC 110038]